MTTAVAESLRSPAPGRVGVTLLILTESALFATFLVTYLFYVGRSLSGPYPAEVLGMTLVTINTVCLLSSSVTIVLALKAARRGNMKALFGWWALTLTLALEFLLGSAWEWKELIVGDHLTVSTNLFGSTYYALVGLHLSHVTVGVFVMSLVLYFLGRKAVQQKHVERLELFSWYWHFVDVVWIFVFSVVYLYGRTG